MSRKIIKNVCLICFIVAAAIAVAVFVTWLWFGEFSLENAACTVVFGLLNGVAMGWSLAEADRTVKLFGRKVCFSAICVICLSIVLIAICYGCVIWKIDFSDEAITEIARASSRGWGIISGAVFGMSSMVWIIRKRQKCAEEVEQETVN